MNIFGGKDVPQPFGAVKAHDIIGEIAQKAGVSREAVVPSLIVAGLLCLRILSGKTSRPAWLDDAPPVFEKHAGPWRGKGSFGTHFGSQAKHR